MSPSNSMPDKAVVEFKELYYKRYGISLSDVEAKEQAINLLNLYRAVLKEKDEGYTPQILI